MAFISVNTSHLQKDPLLMLSVWATVTIELSVCIAVAPEGSSHKSGLCCKNISGSGKMCSAGGRGRTPEIAARSFWLIRRPDPC